MRRELIFFIDENAEMTVIQTETQLRKDVSKIEKLSDIHSILLDTELRYIENTVDEEGYKTPTYTYTYTGVVNNTAPERKIHIINRSDKGAKILFEDFPIRTDLGGFKFRRLAEYKSSIPVDDMEIYVSSNSYKELALTVIKNEQGYEILEYSVLRNIF